MAGRGTSPIGRVSGSGLSRAWVVFEPPPLPATERVGPGVPRINTTFMDYIRKHKTKIHVSDLAALTRAIAARGA